MKALIPLLALALAACQSAPDPVVMQPPAAPVVAGNEIGSSKPAGELVLHKDSLVASKAVVPNGKVVVKKVIKSEVATAPVDLAVESYVIQRVAANGQTSTATEVSLDLSKEVGVASVVTQPTEVVRLVKTTSVEKASVSATLKTEDVEISK